MFLVYQAHLWHSYRHTMYLIIAVYCVVLSFLFYPIYDYFSDPKELRRFPSAHPLAGLTNFWIFSRSLTRQRHKFITAAHQKHGDVVRIAPDRLSFTSPQAYKDIYGFGTSILKDDFYSHVAGGNPSMSQTTSREAHARKRRWMSNVFSAKEITAMEPRVQERVEVLIRSLKVKATGGMVSDVDEYGECIGQSLQVCAYHPRDAGPIYTIICGIIG